MTDSSNTEKKSKPRGGIQPRKQASKSKIAVRMRRKKIIKAILDGKTQQEAGIIAGFKPEHAYSQVSKTLQNPIVQNALIHEMEKMGMTDDYLAAHLRQLIEGTKIISANIIVTGSSDLADAGSMTRDFIEVPDNQALAKGLELACKLKGAFAAEKHNVNVKRPLTVVIRRFSDEPITPPVSGEGATT
jgi:hypothetical protein